MRLQIIYFGPRFIGTNLFVCFFVSFIPYVGANDAIAEATLNLRSLFAKALANDEPKRVILDRQWVQMTHPNYGGPQGSVELTVEIIPAAEARAAPVGLGREQPNRDPVLPEPKRPERSFNPINPANWVQVRIFNKKIFLQSSLSLSLSVSSLTWPVSSSTEHRNFGPITNGNSLLLLFW